MYRKISSRIVVVTLLLAFGFPLISVAQDTNQTIPITVLPTRRIEPPSPTATPQELEERGDQLRGEKAYLDAIDYYHAAIKKLPKGSQMSIVYNKIGMAHVQMGHFDEAKRMYQKAVKIDKTNAYALNNVGSMFYYKKKYGKAIKYDQRAIALLPNAASFHANLGSAYFGHKEHQKAYTEYMLALQLDPNVFEHRSSVGISALMSPQDRATFSYVLAKMYAKDGQVDRALLYLRRAMEEGYKDIDKVYKDQEFDAVRKDERFTALMSQPPPAIP